MDIAVTSQVLDAMERAARAAHPREACGILLGEGGWITQFIETANVHGTPETHFEIDPQALIDAHRHMRAGGPELLGYFHSHPKGAPAPSQTDSAMAARDGRIWAISGKGDLRFWRDEADGFAALSYSIQES